MNLRKTMNRQNQIDAYVAANRKSPLIAFFAAAFLGPIGYLYTSMTSGVILVLVVIGCLVLFPPLVAFLWLIGALAAPFEAASRNKSLRTKAELITGHS